MSNSLEALVAASTCFAIALPTPLERAAWELARGVVLPPGGLELQVLLQPLSAFMAAPWQAACCGAFSDHFFQKDLGGLTPYRSHVEKFLLRAVEDSCRQWRRLFGGLAAVAEGAKPYALRELMGECRGLKEPLQAWEGHHRYQSLTFQAEEAYKAWHLLHPEEDLLLGEWALACEAREKEWRESEPPF